MSGRDSRLRAQRCAPLVVGLFAAFVLAGCETFRGPAADLETARSPLTVETAACSFLAFTKVVVDVPMGTSLGKHHDAEAIGAISIGSVPIVWTGDESACDVRKEASEKLRALGYAVLGGSDGPFEGAEVGRAQFLLGGTVTSMKVDTFRNMGLWSNDEFAGSESTVSVRWELYDQRKGKSVFAHESRGYGRTPSQPPAVIGIALLNSLDDLLSLQAFVDLVAPGSAYVPSSSPDDSAQPASPRVDAVSTVHPPKSRATQASIPLVRN